MAGSLLERLKAAPQRPGVYLLHDEWLHLVASRFFY
jgi:excinuclease UvrABC nuclease subunit